ncbi:hypothetical protein [uncultured Sphingomonas sp.]|uniref:hypothetical protein n=1 Tax=uncultured Sphingomonas sp. TaxID=158754 RepID=UPI0025EFCEC2|nr:hypothetical protein [uncultured Sphingomonas sp.]
MTVLTSRRALIGSAGLAAVTLAAPVIGSIPPSRSEWNALVAAYQQADARMTEIGLEHDRRWKEYQAGLPLIGPKPEEPKRAALPREIADMTIAQFRAFSDEHEREQARLPEQQRYWIDLAAWKAREKALDARTLGDVNERWEASVDAQTDAEAKMLACPAPDAAALAYKMAVIERSYRGCDLDGKVMVHIFADARRLLKMGA